MIHCDCGKKTYYPATAGWIEEYPSLWVCPECWSKKHKRFFLSVVEYGMMNPDYQDMQAGRIEVFDSFKKSHYQDYEASYCLPLEIAYAFRNLFDFKYFNKIPYIRFDYSEVENE